MNQLSLDKKKQLSLPGMKWTPVGLKVNKSLTEDQWQHCRQVAGPITSSCMWVVGDLYRIGAERNWGDTYDDAQELFGIEPTTAQAAVSVCREFDFMRRRMELPFNYHREVQGLEVDDQDELLDWAEEHKGDKDEKTRATQKKLRAKVRERRLAITAEDNPLPRKKFGVILVDPPWQYDFSKSDSRKIENQYQTMELDELCELDVPASENAVMFMWVTSPKASESMTLIESWGFEYKTCLVWVKDKIGMGYYARQRHELLFVCARGETAVPDPSVRPDSVIEAPRGKHSEKPIAVYEIIEAMYPNENKLEMFCRKKRKGWEAWGNEA